ncbi:MAG: glucose 1-dehydrogenase [Spirochaetaceae bacterium]|nr:MAG: glucose 1-dehydrogenase [Spirochaetaceae bacterium]
MDRVWNKKRVAVVTGAGRGIGRAIATALARAGAAVAVLDRDDEAGNSAVAEIGSDAAYFPVDMANNDEIKRVMSAVAERFGAIDILVNNVGVLSTASISEITEAEWRRVIDINLTSAVFASQCAVPYMEQAQWGRIVNIASMAGRMGGVSTGVAYSVSKAALLGFTMYLARNLARRNITVNAIAPGPTKTELLDGFTPAQVKNLEDSIPLRRLGKPENIAETVVFLASDAAEFMTGATVDVNGGLFMG